MKRESEARRWSELPADLTDKPRRVIPVDPIISPFDSGADKVPREDTPIPHWLPEHPSMPDLVPKDTKDSHHHRKPKDSQKSSDTKIPNSLLRFSQFL